MTEKTTTLQYRLGRPDPLDGLDERALSLYERACDLVAEAGMLSIVDSGLISRYCQGLADWERETKALRDEGFILQSGIHNTPVRNPRQPAIKSIEDALLKAEKALGFSPAERSRIKGTPPKRVSKLDQIRNMTRKSREAEQ